MSNERWRQIALTGHTGDVATALAAVDDPDPVVRELALGALRRLDVLTVDALVAAFADPHSGVRRRAALLAGAKPGISLLFLLDDPDPTVAEAAAFACGEQEQVDDDVLLRLVHLASHAADALVREAAIAALGAIGDERGLPAILVACTDKPAVRRRAVLALAPFDGAAVVDALRVAMSDRDWQVRQSAEDVLRARGD